MDKYYFTSEISELLNPRPLSKYFERQREDKENSYSTHVKAPVGCTHIPCIPPESENLTFGVPTVKDLCAKDIMYPYGDIKKQSVYSTEFHYKRLLDSSASSGIKPDKPKSKLDNSGEQMKELLNYNRNKYSTVIVPSSYAKVSSIYYKDKPIIENIYNYPDHGEFVSPSIKSKGKLQEIRQARKDKKCLETLWNLLKIKNHTHFMDLLTSFKAYKNGNDKITPSSLQRMCLKFGITAPLHVIEKLIEECDIIDKDGTLNFEEFVHGLNWKNMLPVNSNIKTSKCANDWREGINDPSQDTIDFYRTTSSFIGDHKYSVHPRSAGLPSIDEDFDRSKLKGVSEFNEYGDVSTVLQPDSFLKYGVVEEDLKELYSKEQIQLILSKSGIKFSDAAFKLAWENVNYKGKASIGAVWNALKNTCLSHCSYL